MTTSFWLDWLDNLARTVRVPQRRTQLHKRRRSVYRPLVLERLEDRIAPAGDITVITSGVGSLDSVLVAHNGVITINDGGNGGTQAETISVAALKALPGIDNINIAARNSITFDDLTPIGGTLALQTNSGQSDTFSTTSGAITFVNPANSLTTNGNIQFTAGTNLTLADLSSFNSINLTTGAGGTLISGTSGTNALFAENNITISADNIVLNKGVDATSGSVTLQQATGTGGGGLFATTRNIDIGGGATPGDLNITDADLGLIRASDFLRIGRLDNPGNITVTDNTAGTGGITAHAGFNALDLLSGGSISEADAKATIAVQSLALVASTGIGASNATPAPLETQIGNLQAQTATGGIFINNGVATPTTLNVTLVDGDLGFFGVQVTGTSGDIHLINNGSINIANQIFNKDLAVSGPGNVTVQANGSTSDVVVGGQPVFGGITGTGNGVVTVQAGRDITLGNSGFGDVVSKNGGIAVEAGRNLTLNSSASLDVESGAGSIMATAGGNITMVPTPTGFFGPLVQTQGGSISLTTGTGGSFTADVLNENNAVVSNGGNITVSADNIVLNKTLDAATGIVTLQQATGGTGATTRNIDIGGGATAGALDLTDAELGQIIAGVLRIGRVDNAGNLTVTDNAAGTGGITAHTGFNTLDLRSGGTIGSADSNATITATNLALIAANGIGSASPLPIAVANLSFSNSTSGGVQIGNTGDLTITTVDMLTASVNFGGAVTLSTVGALTFAINTHSAGAWTAAAIEPNPANHAAKINFATNDSLQTENGNILLQAGDNINMASGSFIQSNTGTVALDIGFNTSDPSTATLQGGLRGTPAVIQAGSGNATVLVDFANGASVGGQGLTFHGGTGNNTLIVSDQNDAKAHTFTVNGNSVVRDGFTINYTNVASVTVTGGSQSDTFNVAPSASTTFTVNGGNPTPPTLPGDTLNVNLAGITTPQLIDTLNAVGFAGTWTFGNAAAVHFTGMETVLPTAALSDLAVTASGPVGNLFGGTLTYTYTLTNNGPSSAANVVLTASLPAGANVVSARQVGGGDPFAGAVSGSTVTFSAPLVSAGGSDTFQVVVSVAGGTGGNSSLHSTATVQSGSPDPNGGNNTATTPDNLLAVVNNQVQVNQQAAGQVGTMSGEFATVQQFLFWFGSANAVSGGALNLVVDELYLALGEMAMADGFAFQGFVNSQEQAIAANPLYDTVAGYELGLWSDALASILF